MIGLPLNGKLRAAAGSLWSTADTGDMATRPQAVTDSEHMCGGA